MHWPGTHTDCAGGELFLSPPEFALVRWISGSTRRLRCRWLQEDTDWTEDSLRSEIGQRLRVFLPVLSFSTHPTISTRTIHTTTRIHTRYTWYKQNIQRTYKTPHSRYYSNYPRWKKKKTRKKLRTIHTRNTSFLHRAYRNSQVYLITINKADK